MKPYLLFAKCSPDDHRAVTVMDYEECFASLEDLYGHYYWFCRGCDALVVHSDGATFAVVQRLPE